MCLCGRKGHQHFRISPQYLKAVVQYLLSQVAISLLHVVVACANEVFAVTPFSTPLLFWLPSTVYSKYGMRERAKVKQRVNGDVEKHYRAPNPESLIPRVQCFMPEMRVCDITKSKENAHPVDREKSSFLR